MKYKLTRLVLEEHRSVTLSIEAYRQAKDARRDLLVCLMLEERFNLLLENYAEFEADLLNIGLRHLIFEALEWSDLIEEVQLLNRRAANLLTICRLYLDQTPQSLNDLFGSKSHEAARFEGATKTEYEQHLGYRAMEALRNYVQHRGLPVQAITHRSAWREDRSAAERWVVPAMKLAQIREIGGFKPSVLEELERLPQPIDLREITREYITCLRRLHQLVRVTATPRAEAADRVMEELAALWAAETNDADQLGLEVIALTESNGIADQFPVLLEVGKRRRYLAARNKLTGDFRKHVVTNKLS